MGSLLPAAGQQPKFSQLYIVDTDNEVVNRKQAVSSGSSLNDVKRSDLQDDKINIIKTMLDSCNPFVKSFKMVRECFKENDWQNVSLQLISTRKTDGRTYNLPTISEVVGLIIGDTDLVINKRDIVVRTTSGMLQQISELHTSYLALQYPPLFPFGEDGFRVGIKHRGVPDDCDVIRKRLTMREFFCYRLQDRPDPFSFLLNARKLFHQFLVDAYTMVESDRLCFIKTHQKKIRTATFKNLTSTVENGVNGASSFGKCILLPSSFTGGSRYMMQKYMDAMAICKTVGYPDLFFTITCNPNWPEVYRYLIDKKLRIEDRPDILSRIFKIKLDQLIHDFKKEDFFVPINAVIYTVEFQKRGLPHAHICLFLKYANKFSNATVVDRVINAEIPDQEEDLELYELVKQIMMHGPCGVDNPACPCMVQGKCSKKFPNKFQDATCVDSEGYPVYRRRDTTNIIEKNGIPLNNLFVVPYNATLLRRYQCHINVECCNQSGSIKYLFKFINKCPDRVTTTVFQNHQYPDANTLNAPVDEVNKYLDCRYVSASEAAWRIFGFDIHFRFPPVEVLSFHYEDEQSIVYDDDANLCDVVTHTTVKHSMFIEWMQHNRIDSFAKTLKYVQFPKYYVSLRGKRKWKRRSVQTGGSIGRISYVLPSLGETYYLWLLLNHVKGPTCFDDIETVNGKLCNTFKKACLELGHIDDDKEYINGILEAISWASASYLRKFFIQLLLSASVSCPAELWAKTSNVLCEEILHTQRIVLNCPGLQLQQEQLENLFLSYIEQLLLGYGSTLMQFPDMPFPTISYASSVNNQLICSELLYDKCTLRIERETFLRSLTVEQRQIYDTVMKSVATDAGGLFFVYGYGGTRKTFLWKNLTAGLRSQGDIVMNVPSSGIASLLLTGGRTAHSRFVTPININENSFCSIDPSSDLAALIKITKLIIWDEAPMIHKYCFKALERTLRDLLRSTKPNSEHKVFGGKVVVLGGDFRQILPVIPKGSRSNIVNASLNSAHLWHHCRILKLTVNMRLQTGSDPTHLQDIKNISDWILKIGDGVLGGPNDGEVEIQIPDEFLILDSNNPLFSLIDFTYPNILLGLQDPLFSNKELFSHQLMMWLIR